jgi:hypothetical protein
MRYLSKIIFINSAQIKYSEINLDGNVHFIGTQGVGKSTLLRAILFFYNADTLGLGIPKQKNSYTDYYFSNSNSYVVCEVTRGEGKFCVVSYKSQHKVCFRFFDGEYKREYFISENGNVPENWEGIAKRLDSAGVYYTRRKVDEHKEYRDILYGNHDGKRNELKRYSLMESRDYLHVPKTIQNVFLNSKMEAEFIKQTIIMSLENDIIIDLKQYSHHLTGFETQLADIRKFKMPGTLNQAGNISKLYIAITHLEKEIAGLAKELALAVERNARHEPEFQKDLERDLLIESDLKQKIEKISEAFKTKESKLKGDIRVLEENIKKAKILGEEYERKSIRDVIRRVEKKNQILTESKHFQGEKDLLFTRFAEIEQKYTVIIDNLKNQFNDFLNSKNSEKNNINANFLTAKDEISSSYSKQIAELNSEFSKQAEYIRNELDAKMQATTDLKIRREGLKHKQFFEQELAGSENEKRSAAAEIDRIKTENTRLNNEKDGLQRSWDFDAREATNETEREKEKHQKIIAEINSSIETITGYLEKSKDSFYGWLSANYPGWENSIGKVIDESSVLFNINLSPRLKSTEGNLFGVELDLESIDKNVRTLADYEKERSELIDKINLENKIISDLTLSLEKTEESLKRKYQPKIREKKEQLKTNEYLNQKAESKLSELSVTILNLKTRAEDEKKKMVDEINHAISEAVDAELTLKDKIQKNEENLRKQIKAREKEKAKEIEEKREQRERLISALDAEIQLKKGEIDSRIENITIQKTSELTEKGADTHRISEIEKQLTLLQNELEFIEQNSELVVRYRVHKEELFDRIGEFKNQKLISEKQFESESGKFLQQKNKLSEELETAKSRTSETEKKLESIRNDNETFEIFRISDLFKFIEEHLLTPTKEGTNRTARQIIDEIKEIHYEKISRRYDDLKKTTNDFTGKFSNDNIFRFTRQLSDNRSYLDFAYMLNDFIEEKKMEKFEKEVNERFALIISTIGTETNNLVSRSGEIQKIIKKINDDFLEKNFVGVIRKIELKIEDSKNEIVQLLISIRDFNETNILEFGAPNLFSSENQDKKNKEAVDLISQFAKKITEMKKDTISLSDSFELKFRIEENQNDTGWVEKLSNVGSDGTDVLVKAMVNIMLLNVFKEGASKKFRDFRLHCMMDEIGKLHPTNVRGILKFANDRNIWLINGSPIENDALAFTHIYKLDKDDKSITRVKRILTQFSGNDNLTAQNS